MEHFRGSLRLRSLLGLLVALLSLTSFVLANKDLYKILGVEKGASQRDIQKAFHRLSLKYHPDKNSAKNAEAKFAEINNAYEVLSDEEKRKNYDLYGDEQGPAMGPEGGGYNHGYSSAHSTGGHDNFQGWTYFTSDSNDNSRYRFEQQTHGFGGGEASYSQSGFFNFPFGSNPGGQEQSSTFGFGGDKNIFRNIFDSWFGSGNGGGQQFTSDRPGTENSRGKNRFEGRQSAQSSISADQLTFKDFKKKVLDQFYTWAILFSPDASIAFQENIQLLEQIAASMRGSIQVGYVKCDSQQSLCREQKMWPLKNSKLLVYSLRNNGKFSALEYTGEWSLKAVKQYCVEALPRFSKHIEKQDFGDEISHEGNSPQAVLLTRKKETPAIWRALSGLFYGRVLFYDAQVNDGFDRTAQTLGVDSFPAVVGISASGKTHVLNSGSELEQASSLEELKALIEEFEKISKSEGPRKDKSKVEGEILLLTKKSSKNICSRDTPLCIIAIFRSASGKALTKQILKVMSQKTLVRRGQRVDALKNPVSYCVLDATKQSAFLHAFDKSGFKSKDTVLIAYKPKKGTYASYDGPLNLENAERFVVEVLGGDLQIRQILQDPVLI